jgi:error-prone DNA polymerase
MPDTTPHKLAPVHVDAPDRVADAEQTYAELSVTTSFSFLHSASQPDELVNTAASLGIATLAITDINTLAGVVRAYEAAQKIAGFRLIVGARLVFSDGTPDVIAWPVDRAGYADLCRLLTLGRRRAPKGECHLTLSDFLDHQSHLQAGVIVTDTTSAALPQLQDVLRDRLSVVASCPYDGQDELRLEQLRAVSASLRVPMLATNDVCYHDPTRRELHDVLTCVRHHTTIQHAGAILNPNAERYLKSARQMHKLFARHPQAIARANEVASRCRFCLSELRYEYPTETVPDGTTATDHLRALTFAGAKNRYPDGIPDPVLQLIEKELRFICGSQYESYFLTVHDLVDYARSRGILCQGRGSAANSAVCYCLGVTAVDPAKFQLVFERFASDARNEPPDIDIDFEHERREEVVQYVYDKYGRHRAAMTAAIISYRGRSAIRDVAKALGFEPDAVDRMANQLDWWHSGAISDQHIAESGLDPADPMIRHLVRLTGQLLGFPRHLSQHVGGMVISRTPLSELVPIENASMPGRTVIEWDKDDLGVLKLFKVDLLCLGMLTCLSKSLQLLDRQNVPPDLAGIPFADEATYDMICRADTVGVFQIESRAQMSMLPRLRPREFYDLVIEVAIVRPGPIQGEMVHPYLRRRQLKRANPNYQIRYPKDELKAVLERTLGVPLFQEQAMRLAIVAAGFSGAEADELRRSMAAWKRKRGLDMFYDKFVLGMVHRGYQRDFAERCFKQISGFGDYGFPESHAASFAYLVYASAWIKCHHPDVFACALLNSQPMGFYAPAQIVRDAREHGVEVRPVDVNFSGWDNSLEDARDSAKRALRLGFRQVKGLRRIDLDRLCRSREERPFTSVADLHRRSGTSVAVIRRLAEADAFSSLGLSRRLATWAAMELDDTPAPLFDFVGDSPAPRSLPMMSESREVLLDYHTAGLSLKKHPVTFVRPILEQMKVSPNASLRHERQMPHDAVVRVAGLVLVRQRPSTASGVVFITLEDETGVANLIVWADTYEKYRHVARRARLLCVHGTVQREGDVVHVLVRSMTDLSRELSELETRAIDSH